MELESEKENMKESWKLKASELELKLAMTAQVVTLPLCWSKSECWGWRGARDVVMSETVCRILSQRACCYSGWMLCALSDMRMAVCCVGWCRGVDEKHCTEDEE